MYVYSALRAEAPAAGGSDIVEPVAFERRRQRIEWLTGIGRAGDIATDNSAESMSGAVELAR
ncbi:hypothetical protein [Burkholderia sp. Bp8963]|uniref:hypothetical protein n=1 Tax=Burkholderia sp. Bp8963 TaxID=2184547 RepID=UPI000F59F5D7|nr:hypothetical protein [Burkholderia sp. Bp8963]